MSRAAAFGLVAALSFACGSSAVAGSGRDGQGGGGGDAEVEDRGPFDRIAGFRGEGELLALRDVGPERQGDLFVSPRGAEALPLAANAILDSIDVVEGRTTVLFATAGRAEFDEVFGWHYASTVLHLWNGVAPAFPLAEGVHPLDHELCEEAGRLWLWTDEQDAYPYLNCGRLGWIDLQSGAAAVRLLDEVCHTDPFEELARFGPGCRTLLAPIADVDLATGASTALAGPRENAGQVRLAADGALVAYRRQDADGSDASLLVKTHDGERLLELAGAQPLRFSDDDAALACEYREGGNGRLGIARLDRPGPLALSRDVWGPGFRPRSVRFSPDGNTLVAFSTSRPSGPSDLAGVDLTTGEVVPIDVDVADVSWWSERHLPARESLVFSADGRWLTYLGLPPDGSDGKREVRVADLVGLGLARLAPRLPVTVVGEAARVDVAEPWEWERVLAVVSPDGTRLAWVTPDGELRRATVDAAVARVSAGPVTDLAITDRELAWIERGRLYVTRLR